MPRRDNRGGRRAPREPRRRTILVYCGGLRTERDYLDGFRQQFRTHAVNVRVRADAVAPEALVRAAAGYRDRRPGVYDEVWCVVDVDEFNIEAAARVARDHRVRLAVSNPCFELWLLLHHTDCRAACARAADVLRRLRRHVPHYDKAGLRFTDFTAGVDAAVKRARDLEPSGQDHLRNPSTNVWQLVERILGG